MIFIEYLLSVVLNKKISSGILFQRPVLLVFFRVASVELINIIGRSSIEAVLMNSAQE